MTDHDAGRFVLLLDLLDQVAEQRGAHRVEARVRLVEEQDLGLEHKGARETGAFAHPARQFVGHLLDGVGQADLLQALHHDLFDLALRLFSVLSQREGDVVVQVHRTEQGAVLEEHADVAPQLEEFLFAQTGHALTGHPDVALVREEEAHHVAEEHALAGPRWPHHDRDLAGRDLAGHTRQYLIAFEGLVQVLDLDHVLAIPLHAHMP